MSEFRAKLIALVFVLPSLAAAFYFTCLPYELGNPNHNAYSPWEFASDIGGIHSTRYLSQAPNGQCRIGGTWLSGRLLNIFKPPVYRVISESIAQTNEITDFYDPTTNEVMAGCGDPAGLTYKVVGVRPAAVQMDWVGDEYARVAAGFDTFWFVATLGLFVIFLREPIFPMLALMGTLLFCMTVSTVEPMTNGIERFPYDFTTMFAWTLAFFLWVHRRYWPMVAVIIFGTLFKETAAIAGLLLVPTGCWPATQLEIGNWKSKIGETRYFGATVAGCLLLHLFITTAVYGHPCLFPPQNLPSALSWHGIGHLLAWELHPHLNWFIFTGGGLLVMLPFMGIGLAWEKAVLLTVGVFTVGQTFAQAIGCLGMGDREFIEIIPLLVIFTFWKCYPQQLPYHLWVEHDLMMRGRIAAHLAKV